MLSMQGHIGPITSMCLSADGSLLVSGSADGTARAYEMERGQCLRVLAIGGLWEVLWGTGHEGWGGGGEVHLGLETQV